MQSIVPQQHRSNSGFTLMEILIVMVIIGILIAIGVGSFAGTQKKSRDSRRKSDLKQIGLALETYYNDKGQYPLSSNGQIVGCDTADPVGPCAWGQAFTDINGTTYMVKLPADSASGRTYFYISTTGTSYQIYARLENNLDIDVPKDGAGAPQVYSDVDCGDIACNYGAASSNTLPATGRTLATE